MSLGKKFQICPILPPMSDLTPFYGTKYVLIDRIHNTEGTKYRDSDPDPKRDSGQWIRIRNSDPGGQK